MRLKKLSLLLALYNVGGGPLGNLNDIGGWRNRALYIALTAAVQLFVLLAALVHCLTGCCAILNPASGHTVIITTVKPSFTVMVPAQWCCAGTATTSCVTRPQNHLSNLLTKTCQHG